MQKIKQNAKHNINIRKTYALLTIDKTKQVRNIDKTTQICNR